MRSMTTAVSWIFGIAAAGLMAGVCLGAEFAADFAEVKGPKTSAGKIYFKDGKVRREVTQGKPAMLIYRPDKDVMWDLNLATKTYLELPGMGHMPTTIPEIQSALKGLGEFQLVGEETINGYPCDKYLFTFNDKSTGTSNTWVSKKLQIAIKTESQGSAYKVLTEYKNIREGAVSDSLFELPGGYAKITVPGMK